MSHRREEMMVDEDRRGTSNFKDQRYSKQALEADADLRPKISVEGWTIIVRGLHEEASEDELRETFSDFGTVKDIKFELDRRTGYAKGYALIKYEAYKDALKAIEEALESGIKVLGEPVQVDFAFIEGIERGHGRNDRRRRSRSPGIRRERSRSP